MIWLEPKSKLGHLVLVSLCPRASSPLCGVGRHVLLEPDRLVELVHAPAWAVDGGLRVLAVIDDAREDLHVALRLHGAAHQAEGRDRLAVLGDEGRDDGVERPLPGADLVGMALGRDEPRGAVLQRNARARHDDARAEAGVVRLDQRHHHARGVGRAEIDRAAVLRHARAEILGLLGIDQLGAALQVRLVEHLLRRHVHESWIGDVAPDVGEGEFHRLDPEMRDFRPVTVVPGDVEVLEDAERHAGGDALARRRELMQRRAAIGEADRIDPVGLVLFEIVAAQGAAGLLGMAVHRVGELAAIEGLALSLGNLGEGLGLVRKLPELRPPSARGRSAGNTSPSPAGRAAGRWLGPTDATPCRRRDSRRWHT